MKYLKIPNLLTLLITLFSVSLAACTAAGSPTETPNSGVQVLASGTIEPPATATPKPKLVLASMGEAPEIENEIWLNTDAPVTLASQKGKVVLLEFWTFS